MREKSIIFVVLTILVATGLAVLAYLGIGVNHLMGVGSIRQGLDLKGGITIVYRAATDSPSSQEMNAAIALIQRRLNNKNYTEAEVARQGSDQIRVDIPGVDDGEQAVSDLGKTAMLKFVDENNTTLLTGTDIKDAQRGIAGQQGGAGQYKVNLVFTSEGAKKFADATSANIGRTIGIYLDDEQLSNPTVNSAITEGTAEISGNFTAEQAEALARSIREGSLPFALEVLSVNNVGARLGANALSTGVLAGIIGSVLILIFMALLYRIAGVAADLALIIYIGIVLIILSITQITLTLPGIAGVILSIGMAVDANVVIFERMREEIKTGRSLRTAVDAGFKRAFPAIVDSNVTTVIAAIVLYFMGTGPVRGFAQTLAIGILVSMFTALTVTRFIISHLVGMGLNKPAFFIPMKEEA